MKYRAFISYRRYDAGNVARWLRRRLLSFRPPRELLDELAPEQRVDAERRVAYFLDTSYQSANQDFWVANIEPALKESEYLIVISSPSALQTRADGRDNWVAREIDTFLKLHGEEEGHRRIIVALAPNASTEIFPGRLNQISTQWDWADLRSVSRWAWLRPGVAAQLGDAFLKIVARIYEVPQHLLPILRREEARRRDRSRLTVLGATGAVVASLSAALIWAMVERGQAVEERARAIETRNEALSSQSRYIAQAARRLNAIGDHGTAMALSLEALPARLDAPDRPYVRAAEGALLEESLYLREERVLKGHGAPVRQAGFLTDGRTIFTASDDGTVRLWNADGSALVRTISVADCAIQQLEVSPDGTRIAARCSEGDARLLETASGRELAVLKGTSGNVRDTGFSRDGALVVTGSGATHRVVWPPQATASSADEARLWDAHDGRELRALRGHDYPVIAAAFSPVRDELVTASDDNTARLWNTQTGALLAILSGHERPLSGVAYSKSGNLIVTSSFDGSARLWSAEDGRLLQTFKGHDAPVTSARVSNDESIVVTGSKDRTSRIWSVKTGKTLAVLQVQGEVRSADFSPDDSRIVTVSDWSVRLWDSQSGHLLAVLGGHPGAVNSAVFTGDGHHLLTASSDATARLWRADPSLVPVWRGQQYGDVLAVSYVGALPRVFARSGPGDRAAIVDPVTGREIVTFGAEAGRASYATFSPAGELLATAYGKDAEVWDIATGRKLADLVGHTAHIASIRFSSDGAMIATASSDKTARVWNARTGQPIAKLNGHEGEVTTAIFSPDGSKLVTTSWDNKARLWDYRAGTTTAVLHPAAGRIWSAVFSPDGRNIVTGDSAAGGRLWQTESGVLVAEIRGQTGMDLTARFSPDGSRFVTRSGNDRVARVWETASGRLLHELRGHAGVVADAAFSPDGDQVMTAAADNTARLWDAFSGDELVVLAGHEDWVTRVLYSPDGTSVLTAASNSIRVWPLRRGQALVDYACSVLPRPLTIEQRKAYFLDPEPKIARCEMKRWD